MGYPKDFKAVSRELTENIVVTVSQFSRFDKVNFGARMALIKSDKGIVVWSAIPYGQEVVKALELLTGKTAQADTPFDVKFLVIPDKEHTMAAQSFKEKYPSLKIIGMDTVKVEGLKIDYAIGEKSAHKVLQKEELHDLGISDPLITENFEFVYLPYHNNNELVMYDVKSKILFEGDLLFNLGIPGTTTGEVQLEQYCKDTGFTSKNPHSGWSYISRYLQPESKFGNILMNKIANTPKSNEGLRAIASWDFEKIVMCHGNIIEKDSKSIFKSVFKAAFQSN